MATYDVGSRTTYFAPGLENATYVLRKGDLIDSDTSGVYQPSALEDITIDIRGKVEAVETGIRLGDDLSLLDGLAINIAKTGRVDAEARAIFIFGSNHQVENHGKLFGLEGIRSTGTNGVIENTGTIMASGTGIVATGPHRVINSGEIHGGQYGVVFNATVEGGGFLKNSGLIDGVLNAVTASTGDDRIINTGTIKGDVWLSNGDDSFVFKAGKVTGEVGGGMGDDRYVVHTEGVEITEATFQGFDLVRSSVSFVLGEHFEQLNLIGKANIDGTGSERENHLQGNAGKNVLRGEGDNDFLVGLGGNDKLYGGNGADDFNFHKGSGRDTVMDFELGDDIEIGGLEGATDFTDMMENHVEQKGADLWITYGKDIVILKDTTEAELLAGDFVF